MSIYKKAVPGLLLIWSLEALAGIWGNENLGQMYWGANHTSAPVVAPNFTTEVDDESIIVLISNYLEGSGQDGWSAITSYTVTCGEAPPVTATESPVRVSGLDEGATYSCAVVATNSFGVSDPANFSARTELTSGGLPIWLLYEATKPKT